MTLDDLYVRGRANALNAIRLCLALLVIWGHSFELAGLERPSLWGPAARIVSTTFAVNGFFAISGFLIYRSLRGKTMRAYFAARCLRILPGFWVALLVVALLFAPIAAALTGDGPVFGTSNLTYIGSNSLLAMLQWDISGSPAGGPYPGVWNGSLWTLAWEFLCYVGLALLAVFRLADKRWVLLGLLGVWTLLGIVQPMLGDMGAADTPVDRLIRFGTFFLAGSTAAAFADRFPASRGWRWLGLLAFAIAMWSPFLQALAAPATAYVLLAWGGAIQRPVIRNDMSYGFYIYAFPVQQALVLAGGAALGGPILALIAAICTWPLAAASWFLVEKPALALIRREPVAASAPGRVASQARR